MKLLEENGISVIPFDGERVLLRRGAREASYLVVTSTTRIHPSQVGYPPEPNALLIAPALSKATADLAQSRDWSAIPETGPAWISFEGEVIELLRAEVPKPLPSRRGRGRPGWGIFSVLRALLALPGGAHQEELARFARVSQPRVSQTLRDLSARSLVARTPEGWVVTDKPVAIDWWVRHYPGPGGLVSHWYGLDSIVTQAVRAYELLSASGSRPAISGDVAADLVAPWREPRHALLYAKRGLDLAEAGLTPSGKQEATLSLVLPADQAIWPVGDARWTVGLSGHGDVARAGALQVLYDLTNAGGSDADDARQAWLAWMLASEEVL